MYRLNTATKSVTNTVPSQGKDVNVQGSAYSQVFGVSLRWPRNPCSSLAITQLSGLNVPSDYGVTWILKEFHYIHNINLRHHNCTIITTNNRLPPKIALMEKKLISFKKLKIQDGVAGYGDGRETSIDRSWKFLDEFLFLQCRSILKVVKGALGRTFTFKT